MPIPRLYASGEFGFLLGCLVPAGNCFPEALSFGLIAGEGAADWVIYSVLFYAAKQNYLSKRFSAWDWR